jgi:hypothetical protein
MGKILRRTSVVGIFPVKRCLIDFSEFLNCEFLSTLGRHAGVEIGASSKPTKRPVFPPLGRLIVSVNEDFLKAVLAFTRRAQPLQL